MVPSPLNMPTRKVDHSIGVRPVDYSGFGEPNLDEFKDAEGEFAETPPSEFPWNEG